jgi:hypothetical protein
MTVDALSTLRLALVEAMEVKPIRLDDEVDEIEREAKRLERWLGVQARVTPPRDRAMAAVRDFAKNRDIADSRQANLVSFGCAERFEGHPDGLIGNGELFPLLLKQVDDFRGTPRHFRDCYQGFLHTYLYYDEEQAPAVARDNWRSLKGYLGERSGWIAAPGYQPEWVDAVQRNPTLFGADPGAFYGEQIFRGDPEGFDGLQRALSITDSSWLVWRIVIGRIEAALRGSDEAVRAAIPNLIGLIRSNARAREIGLALLLGRYNKFASPVLHPSLRDFAVEALGNPWLEMNKLRWNRVEPDSRKMVANWLKLSLIEKFFNLLAQDGTNDTRRLAFWKGYHESIHDMYFALGENARTRQEPDFRAIRKQMEGLQLTLTGSPNKDNNAFIMCIGEHVVVEFGEYANACYIFRRNDLPFRLEGEVAGNTSQLKHFRNVTSLRHTDGRMKWEERFRSTLADVLKVRPARQRDNEFWTARDPVAPSAPKPQDTVSATRSSATQAVTKLAENPEILTRPGPAANGPAPSPSSDFTMAGFKRFCQAHLLEWKDYRPIGGTLKVFAEHRGDAVADQLAAWGFRYKEKFWWSSRAEDA